MLAIYFFVLLPYIAGSSADPCNYKLFLYQELHYEGFHRNLTYFLGFYENDLLGCYVALDQTLPSGTYVDPDELGDLTRMNKLTAIPKNRVNIELPAKQAHSTGVFIISRLASSEVILWLPVHGRYQNPRKGGGYYVNNIEAAKVYIRCDHDKLECSPPLPQVRYLCTPAGKDICVWKEIDPTVTSAQPLQIPVPVGDTLHFDIVSIVSLLVYVVISLYMIKIMHDYKKAVERNIRARRSG